MQIQGQSSQKTKKEIQEGKKKIRDTELKKVPYMLILGEKEVESNTVSVRKQGEGDIGSFTEKSFIELINNQIEATLAQ